VRLLQRFVDIQDELPAGSKIVVLNQDLVALSLQHIGNFLRHRGDRTAAADEEVERERRRRVHCPVLCRIITNIGRGPSGCKPE